MAFTEFKTAKTEAAMEVFLKKRRPPEEIRDRLDLSFRIEGQSVIIFEIRPSWRDPQRIIEEPMAKASYVRRTDRWNIYCLQNQASGRHGAKPRQGESTTRK